MTQGPVSSRGPVAAGVDRPGVGGINGRDIEVQGAAAIHRIHGDGAILLHSGEVAAVTAPGHDGIVLGDALVVGIDAIDLECTGRTALEGGAATDDEAIVLSSSKSADIRLDDAGVALDQVPGKRKRAYRARAARGKSATVGESAGAEVQRAGTLDRAGVDEAEITGCDRATTKVESS